MTSGSWSQMRGPMEGLGDGFKEGVQWMTEHKYLCPSKSYISEIFSNVLISAINVGQVPVLRFLCQMLTYIYTYTYAYAYAYTYAYACTHTYTYKSFAWLVGRELKTQETWRKMH